MPEDVRDRTTTAVRRPGAGLPIAALLIGLWAIVPPYLALFGRLDVKSGTVEFVDHAVPGLVVLVAALLGYLQLRTPEPSQLVLFVGGLVIILAGFWMVSTHYGLITQNRQGLVPFGRMAWHTAPGIAVAVVGVVWTARFWSTDDGDQADSGR